MKPLRHSRLLLLVIFGGLVPCVMAQDEPPPLSPERMQEVKAMKSAYITQRLGLGPEDAQRFWPVYNQYDQEVERIRQERREAHRAWREKENPTDAEARAVLNADLSSHQRELDVRKRYVEEFIRVIGPQRTLRLGHAEREFNRQLLHRMRDNDRRPPQPGRR